MLGSEGGIMGEQLFLERFSWFDAEAKRNAFPNASNLARQFECSVKTAQRSIEFFRCRLHVKNYYSPAGNRTTFRTVEPHHLVNYMGAWHLVAFCRMRKDWRDFHRVSHETEIMMEILRHGSEVEVLEPEWLRDKVKKEIKKMTRQLQKYKEVVIPALFKRESGSNCLKNHIRPRMLLSGIEAFGDDK